MNDIVFQTAVVTFVRDWYYWAADQYNGELAERYRERGSNLDEYAKELHTAFVEQFGERDSE